MPTDHLLCRLSVASALTGAVLIVASATATDALVPPLRTAPFVSAATTTIARPPTTVAPTTTAAPATPPPATEPPATEPPATEPPATEPPATEPPATDPVDAVVAFALAQRGRPYVHGAAGPRAYDCSGLTMMAYRTVGIDLPHYSVAQAQRGRAVDWPADAIRAGDLVFTRGDTPVIDLGHVGLAISATEWVVASRPGTPVRVAPIPRSAIQRVRRLLP